LLPFQLELAQDVLESLRPARPRAHTWPTVLDMRVGRQPRRLLTILLASWHVVVISWFRSLSDLKFAINSVYESGSTSMPMRLSFDVLAVSASCTISCFIGIGVSDELIRGWIDRIAITHVRIVLCIEYRSIRIMVVNRLAWYNNR
jgi:hypothetical protein